MAIDKNSTPIEVELARLEVMKARLEIAKEWHDMDGNSFASLEWVMENLLGYSKEEVREMLKDKQ